MPGIETLGGVAIFQVLVVGPHNERRFRPLQPVSPLLQNYLHNEKLLISHIVIPLRGVEAMGEAQGCNLRSRVERAPAHDGNSSPVNKGIVSLEPRESQYQRKLRRLNFFGLGGSIRKFGWMRCPNESAYFSGPESRICIQLSD